MKGTKPTTVKTSAAEALEREKIKKIMARPINPRTTPLYWLSLGRFKVAD